MGEEKLFNLKVKYIWINRNGLKEKLLIVVEIVF